MFVNYYQGKRWQSSEYQSFPKGASFLMMLQIFACEALLMGCDEIIIENIA